MSLITLPRDLLFYLADSLSASDLNSLSRTNHSLNHCITPYLHHKYVLSHGMFAHTDPLPFGVENGLPRTVELALAHDAQELHELSSTEEYLDELLMVACKGRWRGMEEMYRARRVDRSRRGPALWPYTSPGHDVVIRMLMEKGARFGDEVLECEERDGLVYTAASRNDEVLLKLLIEQGARVRDGGLLHAVVGDKLFDLREDGCPIEERRGLRLNARVLRLLLLEKGLDINALNGGKTPLFLAISTGDCALAQFLLDSGASMSEGGHGLSAIQEAAANGKTAAVKLLVENGADIESTTGTTRLTPLLLACQNKRRETFKALVRLGANVEAKNESGITALHSAVLDNLFPIDKDFLLQVNQEAQMKHTGDTILHLAAAYGDEKALLHFLQQSSNLETTNHTGHTPLLRAAATGAPKAIQILLKNGADTTARLPTGLTPLHIAASRKDPESRIKSILTTLLNASCSLEATDSDGHTPLHHAIQTNSLTPATFLLSSGANHDARNAAGNTPLHLSSIAGHASLTSALLRAGADPNAPNNEGDTPVHVALRFNGSPETVVWTLLAHGGDLDRENAAGETGRGICRKLVDEGVGGAGVRELVHCRDRMGRLRVWEGRSRGDVLLFKSGGGSGSGGW